MEAFMYQAALYCAPCGEKIRADLDAAGKRPEDPAAESTYDSDVYPKGPYPDGGGEADSPQHCDACNVFLENPLTQDGHAYVAEQVSEALTAILQGRREPIDHASALGRWIHHYDVSCVVRTGADAEASLDAYEITREA